jgi:hypothetical protein
MGYAFARRTLVTAALLTSVLIGLPAPAAAEGDPAAARVQQVVAAIDKGDATGALKSLGTGKTLDGIAADPAQVQILLDRAYRTDTRLAADVEGRKTLIGRLSALAKQTHKAAPEDDRAAWAMALALVLEERVGPRSGPGVWGRVADLFEAIDGRTSGNGGEALSYGITFLLEGARAEKDARVDLLSRAGGLTRKAMRAHPKSEELARSLAASHAWLAQVLFDEKRSASKQALRTALDTLKPFIASGDPEISTSTVFNDAVTLGRKSKFAFKDHYFTLPERALEGAVEFEMPMSTHWEMQTIPSTGEKAGYTYVTQKDAAGARIRQILFRRYFWGSDYKFEDDTTVSGDNVKKIVRALQAMTAKRTFAADASVSKPAKHRLTKDLTGLRFEIEGMSREEDPEPLVVHGYAAKGKRQATLVLLVYVYGEDEDVGPEMEALLKTLKEPKE